MSSLEAGEWGPGDAIPSESELALRFGVSQGTVRKAIDEMAAENLLVRRQGKGTFVATHNDPRSFFRFCASFPTKAACSNPTANPSNAGVPRPVRMWRGFLVSKSASPSPSSAGC